MGFFSPLALTVGVSPSPTLCFLCVLYQKRLDCFQEACKRTAETFILTHFHGKGKVTWLQKCPGIRLGGLWPWGVSPKRMFSLEKKKDTGALCNSLWFLLVATDKHVQKKAHGHQHGQACPSSSPCNVRAGLCARGSAQEAGWDCLRWRICPTLQKDMEVDFMEARFCLKKKKKKKSELWESSK